MVDVSCASAIAATPSLLFSGLRRTNISAARCCASAADPPLPHSIIFPPSWIEAHISSPISEMHSNPLSKHAFFTAIDSMNNVSIFFILFFFIC